ncbi:MAG: site-specific integrase [Flavonifractor plautii]|nr:site-specific integrase [Flavonifractor plautii]MDU6292569.1 site-specific integrase [Flavonifractor plautii]MDU6345067.1 site-specific integrase [Flavonifractor plautii]
MKKIKMNQAATMEETFKDFLTSRKIKGVAEKTLQTYSFHLHAVSKHMDIQKDIADLNKRDLESMIASMREAGLSSNTINSYTRTRRENRLPLEPPRLSMRRKDRRPPRPLRALLPSPLMGRRSRRLPRPP